MSSYFLDWDSAYREMRDLCIRANSRPGNRIIVGSVTEKESVEGFFWANKIEPVVEIVVDKSRFLTGEDVYMAMAKARKLEVKAEYYNQLDKKDQEMYCDLAAELIQTINKKGGW